MITLYVTGLVLYAIIFYQTTYKQSYKILGSREYVAEALTALIWPVTLVMLVGYLIASRVVPLSYRLFR